MIEQLKNELPLTESQNIREIDTITKPSTRGVPKKEESTSKPAVRFGGSRTSSNPPNERDLLDSQNVSPLLIINKIKCSHRMDPNEPKSVQFLKLSKRCPSGASFTTEFSETETSSDTR